MLTIPFSTDQFDAAASIERNLTGLARDPNAASRPLIAGSVRGLLRQPPPTPRIIGERLRRQPGAELAYMAMTSPDASSTPVVVAAEAVTASLSPAAT